MALAQELRELRLDAVAAAHDRKRQAWKDCEAFLLARFSRKQLGWMQKAREGKKGTVFVTHVTLEKLYGKDLDVKKAMVKFCGKYRHLQGVKLTVEDGARYERRGPVTTRHPLRIIRVTWG